MDLQEKPILDVELRRVDQDPGSETEEESDDGYNAFADRGGSRMFSENQQRESPEDPPACQSHEFTDYPGSLPSVVKDFRYMFKEGEGSYPEDFPMSLR